MEVVQAPLGESAGRRHVGAASSRTTARWALAARGPVPPGPGHLGDRVRARRRALQRDAGRPEHAQGALPGGRCSARVRETSQDLTATQRSIWLLAAAVLVVLLISFWLAERVARGRERKVDVLNRTLADGSTRNELEARLQRSLEMVHSEEASYTLLNRALSICAPGLATELLLADSSQAHFRQVTTTSELGTGGCAVMSPRDCPAANRGQTQVWTSSSDLDCCPYLQDRAVGACSAVCVPVSIAGNTVGVLHAVAEDGESSAGQHGRQRGADLPQGRRAHRHAARLHQVGGAGAHRPAHRAHEPPQPRDRSARAHH